LVVGSSLMFTSQRSYHMLFLAPRAPRWAPVLRPESIRDFRNTSSDNQSTIDLVEKDATIALKGLTVNTNLTSII